MNADPKPTATLILTIEVPGIYADDLHESASIYAEGEPTPQDYLDVVTEEWMREEVGLTIVTLPAEKEMNSDFQVHAYTARIIGAGVRRD